MKKKFSSAYVKKQNKDKTRNKSYVISKWSNFNITVSVMETSCIDNIVRPLCKLLVNLSLIGKEITTIQVQCLEVLSKSCPFHQR